jgi:hypothetical protein
MTSRSASAVMGGQCPGPAHAVAQAHQPGQVVEAVEKVRAYGGDEE